MLYSNPLSFKNFKNIIHNPNLALKHSIENFHRSNIDWIKVRKIGELDYSKDVIKDDNRCKNNLKEAV